jgi:MFS transporter, PAT family, beta-lactamase induction signal transducer AmpG
MTVEVARPATLESMRAMAGSWRLLSVALLSFASGLPLGLVWIAVPTWMAREGVDIKVIGLFSLAQAPWSFKLLWSPAMDRYPLPILGRRRGYMVLSLLTLAVSSFTLAAVSDSPVGVGTIGALCVAIAFASATFDIAYDAYTVEVLRPEEQGIAVGARNAFYRGAMLVSGGVSITLAAGWGWGSINLLLGLVYLPFVLIVLFSPEPEAILGGAPKTLREAVWGPFVSLLTRHRAFEILAFVVLYKLSDQLTQALTRPFLVQVGFDDFDVGVATATIGQAGAILGAFLGGVLTHYMGLGRALWIFGFLQLFSNLGYALVAQVGVNRPLMYTAQGFEHLSSGLGTGAFGVLLLRMTEKRFSATQYALLSSLFTIPRILAGPVAGVSADAFGWRDFFIATVVIGVPGLLMLARFVPWRAREVRFDVAASSTGPGRTEHEGGRGGRPLSGVELLARGTAGTLIGGALALVSLGALNALANYRAKKVFDLLAELTRLVSPVGFGGWSTLAGLLVVAVILGLLTAATAKARRAPPASE